MTGALPLGSPISERSVDAREDPEIRVATVDEILDLRYRVLIVGTKRASAEVPGDREEKTLHVGAFLNGRAIGCASLLPAEWEGTHAWQLRCMAIEPSFQGKGLGSSVLAYLEDLALKQSPARIFWCNARIEAVGFYEKQGWRAVSEEYVIDDVGPHRRMLRRLGPACTELEEERHG
ncbi:MAG: GNAT family N-acetyltransferase [Candidatus Omnitrophica bacterium]|nr:hypothetical protein [bacterium]NUN96778.1 GNAT family N-acetyltransferase [Candidatus Omnitrophota bacterium]